MSFSTAATVSPTASKPAQLLILVANSVLPDIMVRAAWVSVVMVALIALMGFYGTNRLKGCWDSTWMVETAILLLPGTTIAALVARLFVLAKGACLVGLHLVIGYPTVLQSSSWDSCWEPLYVLCGAPCSSPWSGQHHAGNCRLTCCFSWHC